MAIITRDLQIADKPTLDDVKSMLQNGTYGLNAIRGLLQDSTYGLSALKAKLNGVDKKNSWTENSILKTMAEFDYSAQTASSAQSKKNTNIIFKKMVQRSNENGDIVYGLESPVGNKNGADQYVLLCYSNNYSFYGYPSTDVTVVCRAINDIILSDTKCIRKHISADATQNYRNRYSYMQELIMLDPLKYGINMESYLENGDANRDTMQKIFRDIVTYDYSQISSDKLSIINRLPIWWYIANPNQLPTFKGTSSYYYSSDKSIYNDYAGMSHSEGQGIFTQGLIYTPATTPTTDVRILNAPIISNYFDIKLRTLSSVSTNLPSNAGIKPDGTYNYAVFLKL